MEPELIVNEPGFRKWSNGAWDRLIGTREDGTKVWKIFRPNGPFEKTVERKPL